MGQGLLGNDSRQDELADVPDQAFDDEFEDFECGRQDPDEYVDLVDDGVGEVTFDEDDLTLRSAVPATALMRIRLAQAVRLRAVIWA